MTPNTTQTPKSRPARRGPEFDTVPGEWLATGRASWELGKWILGLRSIFFGIAFGACLFPGAAGGFIFISGFLAAVAGDTIVTELDRNRVATALRMLPVRSRRMATLIWVVAVLCVPLMYGCVQIPVRLIGMYHGVGDLGWFAAIAVECVLATGLASLAFLGRTMAPWNGARAGLNGKLLYGLGQALLGAAYFGAFGVGWILNREDGIRHPVYIGAIVAATFLVAVSFRVAPYTWDSVRQTRMAGPALGRGVGRRARPARFADFFGLWIRPTLWVTGSLAFMCLVIAGTPFLMGERFAPDLSSDSAVFVTMPIILLMLYVRQQPQMEYRLVRSLPLRRSHQTLLILTFGLPFILPLSALVLGLGFVLDWSLLNTLAFIIAFAGCCDLALILWPTIGIIGVFGAAFLCAPLVFMASSWDSPWALCFYGVFAFVFWLGSYAFTYQQLGGDGALYGKRDVIGDVVAGRE